MSSSVRFATLTLAISVALPAAGEQLDLPNRLAAPETPPTVLFHRPMPQFADLGGAGPYYPDRAARFGLSGVAVISCEPKPDGTLTACVVLSESPTNQDFGNAALVMARRKWITAPPKERSDDTGGAQQFQVPFVLSGRR